MKLIRQKYNKIHNKTKMDFQLFSPRSLYFIILMVILIEIEKMSYWKRSQHFLKKSYISREKIWKSLKNADSAFSL